MMRITLILAILLMGQSLCYADWVRYDKDSFEVKHYSKVPFTGFPSLDEADAEVPEIRLVHDVNLYKYNASKGKVELNATKKNKADSDRQKILDARASARQKLIALGLTTEEVESLFGKDANSIP